MIEGFRHEGLEEIHRTGSTRRECGADPLVRAGPPGPAGERSSPVACKARHPLSSAHNAMDVDLEDRH